MNATCKWIEDENGTWTTECGHDHVFPEGGPLDNQFDFCPYCGGEIDSTVHLSAQDIADEKGDREYQARKDIMCGPDQPDIERGPW